ncbi:TIGR04452 family lipoprotein [Leptospira ognonensis]|uniref:TIGR04452 family lipoprotein n=1 Tax=Leptospira ognonensis TaxID=2484945 RepID=A0A4R9JXF9_9LEPT|nr:TIGR04452 family lipoprotein [Leptospira ognonensis]TGL57162.1 TIGR04452 family lipoprotein [Leptospira ognonensis]
MLKSLFIILIGISLSGCAILNPVGLNADREKGSEAATRIRSAAITTDLANSLVLTGGRSASVSILSLIADDLANIDPSKYYVKSDVDGCVKDIRGLTGFLLGATLTNLISCQDLKKDGILLGDPLPSI